MTETTPNSPKLWGVAGAILLLIGIALFFIGQQGIQEYQTIGGQAVRVLSTEHRQQYEMYSWMRIAGGVIAVLGLVSLLGGD